MLGTHFSLPKYLQILSQILTQLSTELVESLAGSIYATWTLGRTVFLCGEGASGTTAKLIGDHWVQEGLSRDHSKQLHQLAPVQVLAVAELRSNAKENARTSLKDPAITQLSQSAQPGDLLLVFSISDPSPGIRNAVDWANHAGLSTWALTAHHGGGLRKSAQHHLSVPLKDRGLVQSIHLMLMHWVGDDILARLHQRGRYALADFPAPARKSDEQLGLPSR